MNFERRLSQNQKPHAHKVRFYWGALIVFAMIMVISLVSMFVLGFNEQRLALFCLNGWFCLFTMDIITTKCRRNGEKAAWHDWTLFRQNDKNDEIFVDKKQESL